MNKCLSFPPGDSRHEPLYLFRLWRDNTNANPRGRTAHLQRSVDQEDEERSLWRCTDIGLESCTKQRERTMVRWSGSRCKRRGACAKSNIVLSNAVGTRMTTWSHGRRSPLYGNQSQTRGKQWRKERWMKCYEKRSTTSKLEPDLSHTTSLSR